YYYGDRSSEDAIDIDEESDQEEEMMHHEVGAILKENSSGKILGFISGREHDASSVNHDTQTDRQIGSTMKQLITCRPAIDKGIVAPDTVLLDEKFNYNGYEPANYDYEEEFGLVSTKHALSNSYNLSTLRLWADVREENPQEYFERMNLEIGRAHV